MADSEGYRGGNKSQSTINSILMRKKKKEKKRKKKEKKRKKKRKKKMKNKNKKKEKKKGLSGIEESPMSRFLQQKNGHSAGPTPIRLLYQQD